MKFCAYCGTENQDNARFCEKCGVPFVEKSVITQPVYTEIQLGANMEKKKHKSALIGILTLLLLCGVAATIGFFIIRSHQGYRQTAKQLQTYLNEREDGYWKYAELTANTFEVETSQETVRVLQSEGWYQLTPEDYDFDRWDETYGNDWKVKVRILDVAPMSKQAIQHANEVYQSYAKRADNIAEELAYDCMFENYALYPTTAQELAALYDNETKLYKKTKVKDGKTLTIQYKVSGKNGCKIYAESIGVYWVNDRWIFMVRPSVLLWL